MPKTYEQIEEDRKHFRKLWHKQVIENERLQTENVLMMEALTKIAIFTGCYCGHEDIAKEALNFTSQTAKIQAVLDTAKRLMDGMYANEMCCEEEINLFNAVRALEE